MLLTVTRVGLLRALPCNSIPSTANRHLIQQITVRCKSNVIGYVALRSARLLKQNNNSICCSLVRNFSSTDSTIFSAEKELTPVQFEKISNETLESLTEFFDELIELAEHLNDADVSYGDGVLTVKFGEPYGTYVINRQTPNKQIWLSSPKSGPKRYDFVNGTWLYKHDGKTLHELLNNEIPVIVRIQACFDKCSFSGKER